MIRIYLDWNVFSYLYNKQDTSLYSLLYKNLLKYSNQILVPCTPAHLQDLAQSRFSEKGKKTIPKNLKMLQEITQGNMIIYHDKNNKEGYIEYVTKQLASVYEQVVIREEVHDEYKNGLGSIFSDTGDAEIDALQKDFINLMKAIPSNLNKNEVENITHKFSPVRDLAKYNNLYDELSGFFKLLYEYKTDPSLYRNLRSSTIKELKIDDSYHADTFLEIKKKFEKKSGISLESFLNSENKATRKSKFLYAFMKLDLIGYRRDKNFSNMLIDALHAYYGAHCDIFVVEDKNTRYKAKMLYGFFDIKTAVYTSNELNLMLFETFSLSTNKTLLQDIIDQLQKSMVLKGYFDDNGKPVNIHILNPSILNYFDRIQTQNNISNQSAIFYKKIKNYSCGLFKTEIANIVNSICKELGKDNNDNFLFTEEDFEEIMKEEWRGRTWKYSNDNNNDIIISIIMRDIPFFLCLNIDVELTI